MKKLLPLLLACICLLAPAYGTTYTVAVNDGADLKAKVEAALANDIVEVPAGTYLLSSQIAWPNQTNITLRAASGGNSTNVIISASATDLTRFASLNNVVSLSVQNLTIQNFGGTNWNNDGGVFYFNANATLNLLNCVLSGNAVNLNARNGGCFYKSSEGFLVNAQNCLFKSNSAYYGGVAFGGTHAWSNCVVVSNNASSYGGVAYYGTHAWSNCVVVSNNSSYYGGVAYFGTHAWSNCMVAGNNAFYGAVSGEGTHAWKNCLVANNFAKYGGVTYIGTNTWTNCVVVSNNASTSGGVAYFGTYTWTNCSISANNMTRELVYNTIGSQMITANNTILSGKLFAGGVYPFAFRNCLIQGDAVSNYSVSLDINNIGSSNALFTDSMLHVGPNSPAIDGGSLSLWNANSGNVASDYDGNPRTTCNLIDIGAYQTQYAVTSMNGQTFGSIARPLNIASNGSLVEVITSSVLLSRQLEWPNVNNITLRAGAGYNSSNCIISASATNLTRFASLNNVVSLSVQNLTLQNFGGTNWNNDGGVFYFAANATLNLLNCVLSGNAVGTVGSGGGCFYKGSEGGLVNAQNCLFRGNNSRVGGVSYQGTHAWSNCVVAGNNASAGGGVAYHGTHAWTNCVVVSNVASWGGVSYYGTYAWTNCKVLNNNGIGGGGVGYYGTHAWSNCVVAGNNASVCGGVTSYGTHAWTNCSISGNNTTTALVYSATKVTANNSIFAGKLNFVATAPFAFRNCLIQGDSVSNYSVSVDEGNINSANAYFINNNLEIDSQNSLAINNGSTLLWNANSGNVMTDYLGNPRIQGQAIDIGAYEYSRWSEASTNARLYQSLASAVYGAVTGGIVEVITGSVLLGRQIEWPNVNNITLRAGAGYNSSNCIISASATNLTRFASLNNVVSLSVQNLTLQNFGGTNWNNDGGVFYFAANATLNLLNCVLSGNAVGTVGSGGGCFYKGSEGGLVNAQNCLFRGNNSTVGGVSYYGTHAWTNCVVVSNVASWGGVSYYGTHTWLNCVVGNNTGVGSAAFAGVHTWTNCSISGNNTTTALVDSATKVTANNTILSGKLFAGGTYPFAFRNCLIQGDSVSNYVVSLDINNIGSSNALFTDSMLHVGPNSPAIDGGSLSLWNANSGNVASDYDGNPRTTCNLIDIGAYQTQYAVTSMNGQTFGSIARPLNIASNGSLVEVITSSVLLSRQLEWPNVNNITLRAGAGYNSSNCIISASATNLTRFASLNNVVSLSVQNLTLQNFGGTNWDNDGGVFWLINNENTHINISNSILSGNSVGVVANVGGIIFSSGYQSKISMNKSMIVNNCSYRGGVIAKSTSDWINCSFINNFASDGGVSAWGYSSFVNCVFINNNATNFGFGSIAFQPNRMILINSTASANNSATLFFDNDWGWSDGGGWIYYNGATRVEAYNCVLAGHLLILDTGTNRWKDNIFQNCLIQGDSVSNYSVSVDVGNINSTNAMFMDDSLIVSQNSPAVNAGSNDLWNVNSGNVTSDYRGHPRVLKTTIDIGAFEIDIPSAITYNKRLLSYSPTKPTFTWTAPDSYTPITDYQVYFGPSAQGTSENSTGLSTTYTPPALVKGAYYFRVSAQNADNNSGPWNTVYIYNRPAYRVRID